MRIESVPSSAVPVSAIGQDGRSGAVAVPFPDQVIVVAPVSVPSAVPDTFSVPAHVALNEPFALFDVCSVTFQWKFVHDEGDGTMELDVHAPIKALTPDPLGPVSVLV